MKNNITDFVLLTVAGSSAMSVFKFLYHLNWHDVVAFVGTVGGLYFAYRSLVVSKIQLNNEKHQAQEAELNKKLDNIRQESRGDVSDLKSSFETALRQASDSFQVCLDNKILGISSDLKTHIGHHYGHTGTSEEIRDLKTKFDEIILALLQEKILRGSKHDDEDK